MNAPMMKPHSQTRHEDIVGKIVHLMPLTSIVFLLVLTASLIATPAKSAQIVADLSMDTFASSNIFLDKSYEWDLALQPKLDLGVDFGDYWTVGYNGKLNYFTQHSDLLSHRHQLYLFANPQWGSTETNELVIELSLSTLQNQDEFSTLDLLQPSATAKFISEPKQWLRYKLSMSTTYRWFYDDISSTSLDTWIHAQVVFTLPSRTTLAPRMAYGLRYYTNSVQKQASGHKDDTTDQQMEFGIHASQALWSKAGLQLDYAYVLAFDDSRILSQKFTQTQFTFLGEEFLFSGHVGMLGLKQVIGTSSFAGLTVTMQQRDYAGWPAVDSMGQLSDEPRKDTRLIPRLYVGYSWTSDQQENGFSISANVDYSFMRQWSNSDWYDMDAHLVAMNIWGSW